MMPFNKHLVMPGFRPGIHDWASGKEVIVDGRAFARRSDA